LYCFKELDEAAREIDATLEASHSLGIDLEDRIEIILEILRDKLGIEGTWSNEDMVQGNLLDK
jgi:hypothetical protein